MQFARLLPLLVCWVLCLSGCGSNNTGRIEGTYWSSLKMDYQGYNIPAGAMKLQFFKKDNKVTYKTLIGTFSGTYKLGWGDYVTLSFEKELAGSREHVEKIQIEDDKLLMTDSDGTSATFRLLADY